MRYCSHRKPCDDDLAWCGLLMARLPLRGASVSCESCIARWKEGEPKEANALFPSTSNLREPIDMLDPAPATYSIESNPVIVQHPDRCFHHPKTLNYNGCCSQRTWMCPLHGVVDLQTCRTCKDFEEDA